MLTPYTMKGDVMHVVPLPFGLALALLPRRVAHELRRRKATWAAGPSLRARILTETRYAVFRQQVLR